MTASQIPLNLVLWRGALGKCPNCGKGAMFGRFLKVNDHCEACGEELFHHQADDFPAYLVIVIVGHIVVPLILWVETDYAPSYWVHLALWLPLTLILTLGLLQPIKGMVVAMQWQFGMHGFEHSRNMATRVETRSSNPDGDAQERPPLEATAKPT